MDIYKAEISYQQNINWPPLHVQQQQILNTADVC